MFQRLIRFAIKGLSAFLLAKSTWELHGIWESVPASYQVQANVGAAGRLHVGPFATLVGGALRASPSRLLRVPDRIVLGMWLAALRDWAAFWYPHPMSIAPSRL